MISSLPDRRTALAALALILTVASAAFAGGPPADSGGQADDRPTLAAGAGAITIGNSREGEAVFSAGNLLPGDWRRGSVRISNPNLQPIKLSLAARLTSGRELARAITVELRRPTQPRLYFGPLAGMPKLPLGELPAGGNQEFVFRAGLPAGSGNELQGRSASFDLVWSADAAGPPPRCRLRAVRSRFFVFRGRNRIRLVARYRASVRGRVRVAFFERLRGGRIGRQIGVLEARFRRHRYRWGRIRVALPRPPVEMHRFRRARRGYVARLWVAGTPGYCRQFLNLDLVQLKRFYGQYVWFQRGSFRTVTARK